MAKNELNQNLLICLYFLYKLTPAPVIAYAMYLGFELYVQGVSGHASLVIDAHDVKGRLANGAPGLFFGVGGITALIIWIMKGLRINLGGDGGNGGGGVGGGSEEAELTFFGAIRSHAVRVLSTATAGIKHKLGAKHKVEAQKG